MASNGTILPRLTQAVDRGYLVTTVMKLHGYSVVEQPIRDSNPNPTSLTSLSIDKDLFYVSSPVFKIEDEARVWKLKLVEYQTKELTVVEKDSVSLGDIRIQIGKTRKLDVTGDPNGSQLRQSCQRGIIEDIKYILETSKSCNLLLNLCDVPYPRPEDLCDKVFSSSLLQLHTLQKLLVIHPKSDAEICGLESGVEGSWNRYLATDMVCLLWKKDESYFRRFEKKYLKQVVQNGLHDVQKKGDKLMKNCQQSKAMGDLHMEGHDVKTKGEKPMKESPAVKPKPKRDVQRQDVKKSGEKPRKNSRHSMTKPMGDLHVQEHDSSKKGEKPMKESLPVKSKRDLHVQRVDVKKTAEKPRKNSRHSMTKPMGDLRVQEHDDNKKGEKPMKGSLPVEPKRDLHVQDRSLLIDIWFHPVSRGICLTLMILAFYFLSSETVVTLLLIAASIWFKYGSKKPEFKKYTRSSDPRVLKYRRIYEKEIEKLRYAKDLKRMRDVHKELKESVLNAYAVNSVSTGDIIGIEDHEELDRELELTFKEFVTENDVKTLLHEAHYMSFVLVFTVFLYVMSRFIYLALGKLWRPVRTVAVIASSILLCLDLCIVSDFLSTSVFSARLLGSVEIFSLVFGVWLVTDVTGVLIEIRACIDHVAGVIWREVELEKCILKSPNYIVVKLALDCTVLLTLFPLMYATSGVLSIFSVSSSTSVSVSHYFPPGVLLLNLWGQLAFFGRVLRFFNALMCVSLASKFYGLHKKKEDPLDGRLYDRLGYNIGSITEYLWKPIVKYLNYLN